MGRGEEDDEERLQLHLQSEATRSGRGPDAAVRPAAEQDLLAGRFSSQTSRRESTSLSHFGPLLPSALTASANSEVVFRDFDLHPTDDYSLK